MECAARNPERRACATASWRAFADRRLQEEDAVLLWRSPGPSRCEARSCVCPSRLPMEEWVLALHSVKDAMTGRDCWIRVALLQWQ